MSDIEEERDIEAGLVVPTGEPGTREYVFSARVNINFTPDELCDGMPYDNLVQLVKEIDEHMQDWGFTLEMYEYFAAQKRRYDQDIEDMEAEVNG